MQQPIVMQRYTKITKPTSMRYMLDEVVPFVLTVTSKWNRCLNHAYCKEITFCRS